jgi:hypothetical protein
MGYFGNHLATLVMGVFAAILTGLWPVFIDFAPILNFVFMMAVPIAWFLTFMCWIVQKGTDYSHKYSASMAKKSIKFTADGKQVTAT